MFTEFASLFELLEKQETKVYLVGGAVRDLLLNQPSHDLDFAVLGNAPSLARTIANQLHGAYYLMDAEHGIARVLLHTAKHPKLVLDFSDARGGSLESDLTSRDFTINAIALDLATQKIIDPLEGSRHLREKVLKACSPESFTQDPIRILRAIRFSLYLGLRIEPETKKLLFEAAPQLSRISGERQRDELFRLFSGGKSASAARLLHYTGLWNSVIPEWPNLLDYFQPGSESNSLMDISFGILQKLEIILDFIEGKRSTLPENFYTSLIFLHLGRFRPNLLEHLQARLNMDRTLRGLICLAGLFFPLFENLPKQSDLARTAVDQVDPLIERLKSLAFSTAEVQYFQKIITNTHRFFDLLQVKNMSTKSSDDLASDGKPSEGNPSDGKPSDGKPTIRSHHLSRRTQYRYHKAVGDAGIDICLLTLALVGAQSGSSLDQDEWTHCVETASDLFEGLWGENATILNMPSLITGDDLMDVLGIPAGEKIGQILELVKEEQASGNIHTREQALEFSQIILKK